MFDLNSFQDLDLVAKKTRAYCANLQPPRFVICAMKELFPVQVYDVYWNVCPIPVGAS